MAPFNYPIDKKSAEKALYYFLQYATNLQYDDVFNCALEILYGEVYKIKINLNRRMNFYCKVLRLTNLYKINMKS